MMKYIIKPHARKRMRERRISNYLLESALDSPKKIEYDSKGRVLIKKLYKKNSQERLLLIVGEMVADTLEVITIIDTSRVKKYL